MAEKKSPHAKIAQAALTLAAKKGWDAVTLDAVAKAAKIPAAKLKKDFATPEDIAAMIVATSTEAALAQIKRPAGSAHDKLFDLLMARFDILQKNREGTLAIARAARRNGKLSSTLARASYDAARQMAEKAHLETPLLSVSAAGIMAAFGWAFLAWRRDESRDMAKTMAALDRALRLGGKAMDILFKRKS